MTLAPSRAAAACIAAALFVHPVAAQGATKEPIADNSFLMEEAYNQEPGVVQHISGFTRTTGQQGWAYSFTQEWPAPGQRHQLSYTVPVLRAGDPGSTGIGDVILNYRLQVISDDARGVAFAPRLSVSLPTGDYKKGLGLGGTGWQLNLPVSKTIGASVVSHTNAGATWFAKVPGAGQDASLRAVNLGQSFIWLVTPRFNVMLENVWTRTTTRTSSGDRSDETAFISPGVRWGYDFASGMQVVPGFAFPIGVGQSSGTRQVFVYLSFEHPFTEAARPHPK